MCIESLFLRPKLSIGKGEIYGNFINSILICPRFYHSARPRFGRRQRRRHRYGLPQTAGKTAQKSYLRRHGGCRYHPRPHDADCDIPSDNPVLAGNRRTYPPANRFQSIETEQAQPR